MSRHSEPQLSVSPAPSNYRKPRPLEYADLDEGEEVTHNDGCDCRTCRAWDALIAERDQLRRERDDLEQRLHAYKSGEIA